MTTLSRRSILSGIGAALPFGLGIRSEAATPPAPPLLRFLPFEEAVRDAFADVPRTSAFDLVATAGPRCTRRIEVGECDLVRAGVQGCHNDRPFAGFPAGHLRIVRTGSEPGPAHGGIRLYVSVVEVALTGGLRDDSPSRPLDFASLPPAPRLS